MKAPRAWYAKLTQVLIQFGFSHIRYYHSLVFHSYQGITLYALVYVDDILITGFSSTLVHKKINSLHATFTLKS